MNAFTISLRRRGIVVATIPLTGERGRIGSGADCEVQLNDPFLAPLIAELVRRGDRWYIVDAGSSLEGITRDGKRVVDEPVQPGQTYAVAAFELTAEQDVAAEAQFPKTMIESRARAIPGTILEADLRMMRQQAAKTAGGAHPREDGAGTQGSPKPVFRPIESPHSSVRPAAPRPRSALRIVLICAIAAVVGFIMLLFIAARGGAKKQTTAVQQTVPAAVAAPTQSQPAAQLAADGTSLARNLEFDKALAAWKAAIAAGRDDAETRERIVNGAFELGRAYAAANDSTAAARYFDAVVRFGTPGSPKVEYARRRLGR